MAGLQLWYLVVLAPLVIGILVAAVYWSWIDAQVRAIVVLSSLFETPVLTPVVETLTREPNVEDTVFAGEPSLIVKPAGDGPWPALLFVNGTTPEGRTLSEVQNLARGLARAGYFVVVPDLPGLRRDEIIEETVSSTLETTRAVANSPDARDGRVGLIGASTGATLALLAAQNPEVGERVSVVAGIAPYTDIRTVLDAATTDHYRQGEQYVPYDADPFLSYVVARSMIAALSPGEDREKLREELREVSRLDSDPLARLRNRSTDDLSPQALSVVKLLANEDPERFDELYAALPSTVRGKMERLSPLARDEQVQARVELASGSWDKYFPVSESFAIDSIAPDHRVTVTDALNHAEPSFSLQDIPAFVRFNSFVVRSLRQARQAEPSKE